MMDRAVSWIRRTWDQTLALPLTTYGTEGRGLNVLSFSFAICKTGGGSNGTITTFTTLEEFGPS